MNYDSLHFIMVYNCSSPENAKAVVSEWLEKYGERKFQNPNWYLIGLVTDEHTERRWKKELTAYDSNYPWSIGRANQTVGKWLEGKFTKDINELVDRVDHGKVQIGDLKTSELKVITRHYENRLEANRFRKDNKEPFDMMKGHEFNSGKYNEFGVTQIINSFDGDITYLVPVYCNIEQFKY